MTARKTGLVLLNEPCFLSNGFCVFRWRNAKFFFELPGEMVDGGILQCSGDLGEIHRIFPDHLLALLQFDAADILAGGDLQIFME